MRLDQTRQMTTTCWSGELPHPLGISWIQIGAAPRTVHCARWCAQAPGPVCRSRRCVRVRSRFPCQGTNRHTTPRTHLGTIPNPNRVPQMEVQLASGFLHHRGRASRVQFDERCEHKSEREREGSTVDRGVSCQHASRVSDVGYRFGGRDSRWCAPWPRPTGTPVVRAPPAEAGKDRCGRDERVAFSLRLRHEL